MTREAPRRELAGLAALPFQVAADLVQCIEGVHRAIAGRSFEAVGPMAAPARLAHDGVASSVYAAARLLAGALGGGAGRVAAAAVPGEAQELSRTRGGGAVVAAVNAYAGDRLESRGSDLAIRMAVRASGRDVTIAEHDLRCAFPGAGGRIVLFVHGLAGSEHSWERAGDTGDSYGARLRADLGYTPISLRYNTGLHVSENGRALACLLRGLVDAWPVPVDEIVLIGHSMGGLVVRSACHYGRGAGDRWVASVRHVVCLGTPHLGAPLEKLANLAGGLLSVMPETRPFGRLWNLRSSGIKDLRFGALVDEDWAGRDLDALLQDCCGDVPLLETAAHYFVAATVTRDASHPLGYVLGDMLVRLPSAAGRGSGRRVPFELENGIHLGSLQHFDLLHHPRVYQQLRRWLDGSR